MKTLIIGCRTLERELRCALEECHCTYDIKWIESGLHNTPNRLKQTLQDILDASTGYDRILLAMGFCGNAVSDIETNDATLIIPRVDDCITLLLGSLAKRQSLLDGHGMYFMTEGWLRGERTIWNEYQYAMEKYGKEICEELFETMLNNYQTLVMLDTGCFDLSQIQEEVKEIANTLKLEYRELSVSIEYLKLLLTGPWDDDGFLIVPPHTRISSSRLSLVR